MTALSPVLVYASRAEVVTTISGAILLQLADRVLQMSFIGRTLSARNNLNPSGRGTFGLETHADQGQILFLRRTVVAAS